MRKIERLWKVKDGSSERGRGDRGVQRGEREAAGVSGHVFPESPFCQVDHDTSPQILSAL